MSDGANVYWTEFLSGNVLRWAVGGCSKSPTSIATARSYPYRIAVNQQTGVGGAVLTLPK